MSDIFISYAREDRSWAETLAHVLERQGWSIFWDRRIPTGKSWRDTIGRELDQARCVIVLWSKTSVGSSWVQDEADDARRRGVLVPVLMGNVLPPIGFRSFQAADLANWDGKETTEALQWLLSDLVRSVGSPRGQGLAKGWFAAGAAPDDYEMGSDGGGGYSGYIKSRGQPRGFGTLMTMTEADPYRNKRLRMTGYAKSASVHDWGGFWMRIDGPNQELLGFDNMHDRPITGTTEWTKNQIVLDVPVESSRIAYGVLLGGDGQVWIDDIKFDVVGKEVPTTGTAREEKPRAAAHTVKRAAQRKRGTIRRKA